MKDWWQTLEDHLDQLSANAPDPWGDRCPVDVQLTDDQQRFLEALADQPPVVRMPAAALGVLGDATS